MEAGVVSLEAVAGDRKGQLVGTTMERAGERKGQGNRPLVAVQPMVVDLVVGVAVGVVHPIQAVVQPTMAALVVLQILHPSLEAYPS
jgi:hypothetical protein